jgi:hypothetical protein
LALVQQPLVNQDVVTRMPRPARFSSMAPTPRSDGSVH